MAKKALITLIIVPMTFMGCKKPPDQSELALITLQKTHCYGPCPVYEINIFNDGKVTLYGKENMSLIGQYQANIPEDKLGQIIKGFSESRFFEWNDEYSKNITDLPTTYISFRDGKKQKTIKDYYGAPPQLKQLEQMVEDLIDQLSWVAVPDDDS